MVQTLRLEAEASPALQFQGGIIPVPEIDLYWSRICEELDKVPHLWATHWTKEALYANVVAERFQVWAFGPVGTINVVVFTEIAVFPANKILRIFIAFGNSLAQALPTMEAVFERYAQVEGCGICEIVGRPGWKRKIPRLREVASVLRFEVERKRIH